MGFISQFMSQILIIIEVLYMNKASRNLLHCDDYKGKNAIKVAQGA